MKEFTSTSYIEDILKIIPGYDIMLNLIFHSLLKIEFPQAKINTILAIAGQTAEIKPLLLNYETTKITLVEPSETMLAIVKQDCQNLPRHEKLEYSCQTFEKYEDDTKYNLCLCLLVLQFVENPKIFLEKIYHSLVPGGKLILSIFSNEQLGYWKEYALSKGADPIKVEITFSQQETVMKAMSPNYVESLFCESGFTKITKVCQILATNMWVLEK